jgi:uncharacterized membrane protein YdjX (TVP38/TMEM64 family)
MEGQPKPASLLQTLGKVLSALVLIALFAAVVYLLFTTRFGHHLRENPIAATRAASKRIHHFVNKRPLTAPLIFLVLYVILAVLALPIWWLQLFAGIGFGLYEGTLLSVIGSTIGVALASAFVRWIAADWFHQRVEKQMEQLKKLDETLGHNGFLFVMTARLIPIIPFGLFNYALGLSKISFRDIILGTFLGCIPLAAVHVALGAGYDPHNWVFDLAITVLTLILLTPLLLRYLRPKWFEKIGVE